MKRCNLVNTGIEELVAQAQEWGFALKDEKLSLLCLYLDLLVNYQLANVIGTRKPREIIEEHLIDSLSCLTVKDLWSARSAIDVGSGGGLPGIPLAIARPELQVVLLETTEKKARFLEFVRKELALPNLQVLHKRAEDAGRDPLYRDAFDFAIARALASLPVVVEYCAPFVHTGGKIISMKGRLQEQESSAGVAASKEIGAVLRKVREVEYRPELPQKERKLVVFEKATTTPERFPRRVGLAKKRPLGV